MQKLLPVSIDPQSRARWTQAWLRLLLNGALVASLWINTVPATVARKMTPEEMIVQGLPPVKTIQTATKAEFLLRSAGQ